MTPLEILGSAITRWRWASARSVSARAFASTLRRAASAMAWAFRRSASAIASARPRLLSKTYPVIGLCSHLPL